MSEKFIPLSVPNLSGNEKKYVDEAVETEWVSTGGACINDFEKAIAEYVHTPGAVACQSGTAGLHLAMILNGIGREDEVIAPAGGTVFMPGDIVVSIVTPETEKELAPLFPDR